MYYISLARWKKKRKKHRRSKEGKVVANNMIYYCVSVSISVLGLFQTPNEAMYHFNKVALYI